MGGPKIDVSSPKGMAAFNGLMGSKSYIEGYQFSPADTEIFGKLGSCPDPKSYPHLYRWYIHIAALTGVRALAFSAPAAGGAAPAPAPAKKPPAKKAAKEEEEDDDFDVFGDDEEEEEGYAKPKQDESEVMETGETRREMLARLKKEAEERTARKEAKQRTLVAIEVKPWDTEQDLMALWKKITTTIVQDGLKWGESCTLAEVAFGIKKIQTTFVMGVNNSSDDIVEKIQDMEDEVQSVEVTSMNVL